jgi:hypothetical protein
MGQLGPPHQQVAPNHRWLGCAGENRRSGPPIPILLSSLLSRTRNPLEIMVGGIGIEPVTPTMSTSSTSSDTSSRVPPSAASVLRLITPGTTRSLWLNRPQTANKLRPTRVNVSKPADFIEETLRSIFDQQAAEYEVR